MAVVLLALVLTIGAATGVVLLFTARASSPRELDAWARSYGLVLTPGNRAPVTYYVRLVIVTRVVAAVAGVVLGSAFDAAFGLHTSAAPGWWAWLIGGWTFGAWWAERELRWPAGSGVASLLPRRVADYLPGRLRAAPFVALGIVAGLVAYGWTSSRTDPALVHPRGNEPPPSVGYLVAVLAVGAAVTALTTLGVWRTVSRRQPALAPDQLAADDAIRTSTAHQLTGGGTAVVLCVAAVLAGTLGWSSTTSGVTSGPLLTGSIALWLAAMVSWRYYTYRAWRVRRLRPAPEHASALAAT
ncbi:MAG: hypothetical protein R2746_06650 [Acidimicrobiales bacterium]